MSKNDECTLQEMRAALDSAARLLDKILTSVGVARDRVETVLTAVRDVLAKKCRTGSGEAGDVAELRCALKEVGEAFDDDLIATNCEMTDDEIRRMDAVRWHVKCALSRAPRNCDVGTAAEQADRFKRFCDAHQCQGYYDHPKCPFDIDKCEFEWGQMPYNAQGGGDE